MATPFPRWNDDRLDDLKARVDEMVPTVGTVGILKEQMRGLTRVVEANTRATEKVSEQLEDAQKAPMQRVRNRRDQLLIAVAAAFVSGASAIFGALIASGQL